MAEPTMSELADEIDRGVAYHKEFGVVHAVWDVKKLERYAAALRSADEEIARLKEEAEDWRKSYEVAREETRGECDRADRADEEIARLKLDHAEAAHECLRLSKLKDEAEDALAEKTREIDEALMLTESCSSLKEMASACSARQKVVGGAYRAGYAAGFARAKEMAARIFEEEARRLQKPHPFTDTMGAIEMEAWAERVRALTPPAPEPTNEKAG